MLGRLRNIFSSPITDPSYYRSTMSSGAFFFACPLFLLMAYLHISMFHKTASTSKPEIATFAAGCFWGVEHIFLKHFPPSQNKGILSTAVGYTGGNALVTNPSYELVCKGATDHAEALKIEFDPSVVTYAQLVGMLFFNLISRLYLNLICGCIANQSSFTEPMIQRRLTAKEPILVLVSV